MAAPDPTYVRMYRNQLAMLRENAAGSAREIARNAAHFSHAEKGKLPSMFDVGRLASDIADLRALMEKINTLEDVSYLTTDPDAEEVTPNG